MNGIAFGNFQFETEQLFDAWKEAVDLTGAADEIRLDAHDACTQARNALDADGKLRVSLLGEFSAGKSSLIAALTGADIPIDADVTTEESAEYEWRGVTLVDTPGVQAAVDANDHDAIARKATVNSDLVLFVISNELFNERLANYFHYIAGPAGLGLADKMAVVVNKMDRENNDDDVIQIEVETVIEPHNSIPVMLTAVRYLLRAKDFTGNKRQRLIRSSRVDQLIAGLDVFIEEREALGRLTRPLQLFEDAVANFRRSLLTDDQSATNQLELLRRNSKIVKTAERELASIEIKWASNIRHEVLSEVSGTISSIGNSQTKEELEELFEQALHTISSNLDPLYIELQNEIRDWIDELERELDELDASPLSDVVKQLGIDTVENFDSPFEDGPSRGFDYAKATKRLLDQGVSGVLEGAAKNPKKVRDVVYSVGSKMGKKFRPWEATKLGKKFAQYAGKGSKVLGPLAAGLDFYMEYREEKEKDERERHLAKTRLAMQRQFRELADSQVEAMRTVIAELQIHTTRKMLSEIEEQASEIANRDTKNREFAKMESSFILRSRNLHERIADANRVDMKT